MGRTRLPLVAAFVTLLAAGCGHPSTSLTLVAENPTAGTATFHLRCHPAGGDIEHPARACVALAARPSILLHPKPFICAGGMFSWWDITITGRFHGEPVNIKTSTCWTPQMELIDSLGLGFDQLQSHTRPPIKGGLDTSTLP